MIDNDKLVAGEYCGLSPDNLVKLGLSQLLLFEKKYKGSKRQEISADIAAYRWIIERGHSARFIEWKKNRIKEQSRDRGPSDYLEYRNAVKLDR